VVGEADAARRALNGLCRSRYGSSKSSHNVRSKNQNGRYLASGALDLDQQSRPSALKKKRIVVGEQGIRSADRAPTPWPPRPGVDRRRRRLCHCNIRGGGDTAKALHKAGNLTPQSRTSSDDFYAVAQHLVEQKYTDKATW